MSKKSKQRGYCAFCGSAGVTKQHVWPDWLKTVIPREGTEHSQSLTRVNNAVPDVFIIRPELEFHRGPFGARKIRNICATCNSGWMSRLETAAKPSLTELIMRRSLTLDSASQLSLSAWAVMTSIMAEYTDKSSQSIPLEHRRHLMEHGIPPDGWHIWIGTYEGERWKQGYRHHGYQTAYRNASHQTRPEWSTQQSTFVAGALFIHAASTTVPSLHSASNALMDHRVVQIWPITNSTVVFPTATTLTDDLTDYIADLLHHHITR